MHSCCISSMYCFSRAKLNNDTKRPLSLACLDSFDTAFNIDFASTTGAKYFHETDRFFSLMLGFDVVNASKGVQ